MNFAINFAPGIIIGLLIVITMILSSVSTSAERTNKLLEGIEMNLVKISHDIKVLSIRKEVRRN